MLQYAHVFLNYNSMTKYTTNPHHIRIKYNQVKNANDDYKQVVSDFYRAQAATSIQRTWRKRSSYRDVMKQIRAKNQEIIRLQEMLSLANDESEKNAIIEQINITLEQEANLEQEKNKLDTFFSPKNLYEPVNDQEKQQETVEHIKNNRYDLIDYSHPDFTRHLFAILRSGLITKEEMLSAKLMYESLLSFNNGAIPENSATYFSRFNLNDENAPYRPDRDISYWDDEASEELDDILSKVSDQNKFHYYTINLSREELVLFLFYKLNDDITHANLQRLSHILKHYISILDAPKEDKLMFIHSNEFMNKNTLFNFLFQYEPIVRNLWFVNLAKDGVVSLLRDFINVPLLIPTEQKNSLLKILNSFKINNDYDVIDTPVELKRFVFQHINHIKNYIQFYFNESEDNQVKNCNKTLKSYVKQASISEQEKTLILKKMDRIFIDDVLRTFLINHRKKILSYINNTMFNGWGWDEKLYDQDANMEFLVALDSVDCQIPSICLSPQYDKNNSNSPVLSFVLPTIDTLNILQQAVHDNETTMPMPMIGQGTTRMIRAFDELPMTKSTNLTRSQEILATLYPQAKHFPMQARPIEVTHDDTNKTNKPHGRDCSDFLLTWHDLFHAWRSGANYKTLFRQLRHLHDEKAGFAAKIDGMSQSIWELSDLDFNTGTQIRDAALKGTHHLQQASMFGLQGILKRAKYVPGHDLQDDAYLFIYSLCQNHSQWQPHLFGIDAKSFIMSANAQNPLSFAASRNMYKIRSMLQTMKDYLNLNPNASIIEIILNDLLKQPEKNVENLLLLKLFKQIDYKNIFYWSKNNGIYFKHEFRKQLNTLNVNPRLRENSPDNIRQALYLIFMLHKNPDFEISSLEELMHNEFCHYLKELNTQSENNLNELIQILTESECENEIPKLHAMLADAHAIEQLNDANLEQITAHPGVVSCSTCVIS